MMVFEEPVRLVVLFLRISTAYAAVRDVRDQILPLNTCV